MVVKDMVSIIIPIYNTPIQFLEKCIMSVKNQSYCNYEIIIINDGSIPAYEKYLEGLKQSTQRLKVLHKRNEGVAIARNIGIKISKGEYITFLDADDILYKDFLKEAVQVIKSECSDVVIGLQIKNNIDKFSDNTGYELINIFSNETKELQKNMLTGNKLDNFEDISLDSACGKLFRKSSLKGILFPIGIKNNEDLIFNFNVYNSVNKITLCKRYWYYCIIRSDSASRIFLENGIEEMYNLAKIYYTYLLENHDLEMEFYIRIAQCFNYTMNLCVFHPDSDITGKLGEIKKILDYPIYKKAFFELGQAPIKVKNKKKFYVLVKLAYKKQIFKIFLVFNIRRITKLSKNIIKSQINKINRCIERNNG